METTALARPHAEQIAKFLTLASRHPAVLAELKSAPNDEEFIQIAMRWSSEYGIELTPEAVHAQMLDDRKRMQSMPLEEVERLADGLLGARMSGRHQSFNPPRC